MPKQPQRSLPHHSAAAIAIVSLFLGGCGPLWRGEPFGDAYYQETPGGNAWFGTDESAQDVNLDGWVDAVGMDRAREVGFVDSDYDRFFDVMGERTGLFGNTDQPIDPIPAFELRSDRPPTEAELSRFSNYVSVR